MSQHHLLSELNLVLAQIGATAPAQRYLMFNALDRAIRACEREDQDVPAQARQTRDALADAAIEAQFDNMPV